jgi:Tfp pilus assembly protein PilV
MQRRPPASTRSAIRSGQRGATLLEALVAFVVLMLSVAAVVRVQGQLRLGSDIARQRSEAVRLGQEDLESLRGYAVMAASAGARSYAAIASASTTIDGAAGYVTNTAYLLTRDVRADASGGAKGASVAVAWTDRTGATQQIVLASIVAARDPAYSATLGLAPAGTPVKGAHGRSAFVPLAARDVGGGRSAFKPIGAGTIAYVFDNATGAVVARCNAVAGTIATRDLSSADLAGCDTAHGLLLSGTVRFSLAAPPDAAAARDPALAFDVVLATSGGTYPLAPACSSEALKTVAYTAAGVRRVESVPVAATPASLGLATWSDSGDRHVAYHCVVYPLASGRWSGRTTLQPSGWTLGTGAADRRVCRYAADLDGSGAVDANVEHPASYSGVAGPLANQNFLVVAGPQACPAGGAARIDGAADDVYVSLATVQHQP